MNIAEISIKKRVVTLTLTVVALIAGVLSYDRLGRLEDPEFTIKQALVITPYPGASAEEVETEVTNEIEKAAQKLGQLKRVESTSLRGLSIVKVTIKDAYTKNRLPQVWDELRRKVRAAQGELPPGAGPSSVDDDFGDVYGVYVALTADGASYADLKDTADLLRRELLQVQDVKRIVFWGDQPEAIYVELKRENMAQLGVTEEQVFATLDARNVAVDAGHVRVGSEYLAISPTGAFQSEEELGDLLISAAGDDKLVYLRDIAEIKRSYVDPPRTLLMSSAKRLFRDGRPVEDVAGVDLDDPELEAKTVRGQPAIGLAISAVSGGNVVTMGQALEARLDELQGQIPLGVEIDVVSFQSQSVTRAINNFVVNLVESVAIVVVVLLIFMGLKSGLLIGFVLVMTILASFIVMDIMGITLQRISLGALIIALGMLVDNAIVVTDSMKMLVESGKDKLESAKKVVAQNQWPLLGATVVAVIAFAAIGVSQNDTGEYCRSLFLVLLISLMMSWVTAVTVTPLLCVMLFKPKQAKADAETRDPYDNTVCRAYRATLEWLIRLRWLTITAVVGMFVASMIGFGQLKDAFFPPSTRPQFLAHVWMPEGTHIEATAAETEQLAEYLMSLDAVQSVSAHVGEGAARFLLTYTPEQPNSAYGLLIVSLYDSNDLQETVDRAQSWIGTNMHTPMAYCQPFKLGPGSGGAIQVRYSGPDPAVLRRLANEAMVVIQEDGDAIGIRSDWRQRVKLVQPILAEDIARRNGITRPMVARQLAQTFEGRSVGLFRDLNTTREDSLLPIVARAPESERADAGQLGDLIIESPAAGRKIPLRQVVSDFATVYDEPIIRRRDRARTVTVHCDPRSETASAVRQRVAPAIEAVLLDKIASGELTDEYAVAWGGEFEDSNNAIAALAGSIPVFVVIMVLIVIGLFNNLRQPLIIWLTVPLAMIGVTVGLLAFDLPFNFMALLGTLSLSGMLIKNSIVLIDQINLNLSEGMSPYDAIIDSGVSRARPVMMAAATTVLAMVTLLTDQFFIAMAVAVMFGLTFATVLTLLFVPVLYAAVYRVPSPHREQADERTSVPALAATT